VLSYCPRFFTWSLFETSACRGYVSGCLLLQDGMGGCLTLDREESKARRRSEEIDKQLGELAKQERNVIKILLLGKNLFGKTYWVGCVNNNYLTAFYNPIVLIFVGAGESGKSTLVKQMKIIHSDGFTKEELRSFRPTVMDNLLSSMKYVLTGMGLLRINLQSAKNKVSKVK